MYVLLSTIILDKRVFLSLLRNSYIPTMIGKIIKTLALIFRYIYSDLQVSYTYDATCQALGQIRFDWFWWNKKKIEKMWSIIKFYLN